jgi:hypothetical protein
MASGKGAVKSLDGGWIFDSKGEHIKTLYIDTENSRSSGESKINIFGQGNWRGFRRTNFVGIFNYSNFRGFSFSTIP